MALSEPGASDYAGRKVVVLGATGFIGRWVAQRLFQAGARLTFPVREPEKAQRLLANLGISGSVWQLDLADLGAVEELLHEIRPAVTFNLAGYGVDRGERDPVRAHLINADVVRLVCHATQVRDDGWDGLRFIHAGSALEYGDATGDLNEDTVAQPTTVYGQSKLSGTQAVLQASCDSGLPAVVARLFTVYGPGEREGRLLPSLIAAAKTGEPLALTAGSQLRDFAYVEDVADGLVRLGTTVGASGQPVNLATGNLLSVRDFTIRAAQVLRLDEGLLGFGQRSVRAEEMAHNPVNVNRLTDLTGWRPPADVRIGVERTISRLGEGVGVVPQTP